MIPLLACWSFRSNAFVEQKQSTPISYNPLFSDDPHHHHNHSTNASEPASISNSLHTFSQQQELRDPQNIRFIRGASMAPTTDESKQQSYSHSDYHHQHHNQGSNFTQLSEHSMESLESIVIHTENSGDQISNGDDSAATLLHYFHYKRIIETWQQIKLRVYRIVVLHWWENPSIFFLCLATGVRLGAGYVWSSYTGPFFSDLFVHQENSIHCSYSYDLTMATTTAEWQAVAGMCSSSDYPYCVSSTCSAISQYPWHNKVQTYDSNFFICELQFPVVFICIIWY